MSHFNHALAERKKHSRGMSAEYLSRKSVHIRILPQTFKEMKKFVIDENITTQGLVEYFMCVLLDGDNNAKEICKDYKAALRRQKKCIVETDAKDILDAIEANSPLSKE